MPHFYVSDSFTLNPYSPGAWHFPGPANQDKTWGPNEQVLIDLEAAEVGFVRYGTGGQQGPALYAGLDYTQGINCDVLMCLYDVTPGGPNPAPAVGAPSSPVLLKFALNNSDGQLIHAVHRYGEYSRAARHLTRPLRLQATTPNVAGKAYQVGAAMRFISDPSGGSVLAYEYFLQGTIW